MIWLFLLAIIGIVVYNFLKSRNQFLTDIAQSGGMVEKYKYLVEKLCAHPSAYVKNQGANDILIVSPGRTTYVSFYIFENFGTVEIEWLADYGLTGKLRYKWIFPQSRPQKEMVEEIESYIVMRTSQLFGFQ